MNTANGTQAFIGGGDSNIAGGGAVVGGGATNTATGLGSVVGGGTGNSTFASRATVSGGQDNTANALYATIPGGLDNSATGEYSLAAGRRANATHSGSFVWGDNLDLNKPSQGTNTFSVFSAGGANFFTNSAQTTGVTLTPGAGTWSNLSDRNLKRGFEPVDAQEVLDLVVQMPLYTWSYVSQSLDVRHMGPTAQDFREAFGLGFSERYIDVVDPDGVALTAIQGLNERLVVVAETTTDQQTELASLRAQVAELEALVQRLLEEQD